MTVRIVLNILFFYGFVKLCKEITEILREKQFCIFGIDKPVVLC